MTWAPKLGYTECVRCKRTKYKHKAHGLCQSCAATATFNQSDQERKERKREYARRYYRENAERMIAKASAQRRANPKAHNEYNRRYRAKRRGSKWYVGRLVSVMVGDRRLWGTIVMPPMRMPPGYGRGAWQVVVEIDGLKHYVLTRELVVGGPPR